jgi:predicted permease
LILVALAVAVSTALGVICERRADAARVAAQWTLQLMLYVLVPFVSLVNIAHLQITVGAGVGIGVAWVVISGLGFAAWSIGRAWLGLAAPALGALICSVIIVNTGYFGLPAAVAIIGPGALSSAVAYDQLVSGPMLFIGGFGVGAAFGNRGASSRRARVKAFLTRNPPLVAVVAGLIVPGSLIPAQLLTASHVAVGGMLLLGFFAVGVNLSTERREDRAPLLEAPSLPVVVAVVLRLCFAPALMVCFSAFALRLPSAYLLQSAMPTGISSLIVGHAYGLDQRLIATMIVWSTAAALVAGLIVAAV